MGSAKEKQAARHEALNEVANAHLDEFAEAMQKAYAKRDLGEYRPRSTPEQRAAIKAAQEKAKAAKKIEEIAAKAGLLVDIDGVAEVDWHGDQDGFADEAPATATA